MLEISLLAIVVLVLILPLTIHSVEKNLEAFLFIMGVFAVSFSHFIGQIHMWSWHLVEEALVEPIMISAAVIVVGVIVFGYKRIIEKYILKIENILGTRLFVFLLIAGLGLCSSIITAIMAAILLVEAISVLKYKKEFEIKIVVLGCFAIGLGAALTPIGEPLSTIAIAKLKAPPYNADFFFLLRNIGVYVIPGVVLFAVLGAVLKSHGKREPYEHGLHEKGKEKFADVIVRGGKVYLFIMALVLLGAGLKPMIDAYVIKLPSWALYWINTISAVLDNATLAAAEISPKMSLPQLKYVLMGLLVSGGMLIPGNIPNIISAGRLGITSKQWAKIGLPLGFVILLVYFGIFQFLH
ncbi:DUF1646 family protein [Elusimicrobiota bacterium]